MRKITSDKRNYVAHLPVRCSVVFILKQCGRPCDVVHPVSAKRIVTEAKKVMRFTSWYCCGSFTPDVKCTLLSRPWKNYVWIKETMQFSYPSDAVRFSVLWSTHVDLGVAKNSVRISINLKLLLNRKDLERVFYMKKLRLVDTFPTMYRLNHSEQRFVKNSRKPAAASRRRPHDFQN